MNYDGWFHCDCEDGFILTEDQQTCRGFFEINHKCVLICKIITSCDRDVVFTFLVFIIEIQCVPIKRKPERHFSTNIDFFFCIKYNFHCYKVPLFFFHLTPKLTEQEQCEISMSKSGCAELNGYGLYVQRTAKCSNGLAKGWFI